MIAGVLYGALAGVVALCWGVAFAPRRSVSDDDAVQGGAIIAAAVAVGAVVALAVGGVG